MGSVGPTRKSVVRSDANVGDKNYFHHSAEDLELQEQVTPESVDSGVSCGGDTPHNLNLAAVDDLPGPPDGGWGWVVCFACFSCNFVLDGIAYSFGVMLETLVNHFESNRGSVSWVGSLLAGVYMISGPIVGGIVNKYGCRVSCISGAILSCLGFVLSVFSPNVPVLMLTYGVLGGFGLGLIYLPAVVACGYYFEKRRALATGISVCGSGVGCFAFAPFANFLLEEYGWQGTHLIFAGLCLNCAVFGALMRPLELVVEPPGDHSKPRRGSYITIISPIDDQDLIVPPSPTDKELLLQSTKNEDNNPFGSVDEDLEDNNPFSIPRIPEEDEDLREESSTSLARKGSEEPPKITMPVVEASRFDRANRRRYSAFAHRPSRNRTVSESVFVHSSRGSGFEAPKFGDPVLDAKSNLHMKRNVSTPGFGRVGRLNSISEDGTHVSYLTLDVDSGSRVYLQPQSHGGSHHLTVRPLARKDVFYTGSIYHLQVDAEPELQHRQDSHGQDVHRNSIVSLPRVAYQARGSIAARHLSIHEDDIDQSSFIQDHSESRPLLSVLMDMLDIKLLRNHFFLLVCLSNIFGFLALYIPYVYLPNMAVNSGITPDRASFIISLIGVSNTLGRLLTGAFVDLPWVSSLIVTNCSLILSGITVIIFPFCVSYTSYVVMALLLGLFISAYISLTSIVLVDLIGLDSLTSSFGLLVLGRGLSTIVGPPMAGALYDATGRYDTSFFLAGGLLILAGAVSIVADILWRRKKAANLLAKNA